MPSLDCSVSPLFFRVIVEIESVLPIMAAILIFRCTDIQGSQWGGGFYGYRLKCWPFYGYRLIFFQLRLTKKLKISFFCFKELNISKPVFFLTLKYSTSNIILLIEMSIVNLKIIFVKKQKQTRKRPTQGRGATFIYNRNGHFHTRDRLFV